MFSFGETSSSSSDTIGSKNSNALEKRDKKRTTDLKNKRKNKWINLLKVPELAAKTRKSPKPTTFLSKAL
jgi:hypothetical protein